jgi:hypothetical protein
LATGLAVAQTFTDDEPAAASSSEVSIRKSEPIQKRVKSNSRADVGELQALNLPALPMLTVGSRGRRVNARSSLRTRNGRGALTIRLSPAPATEVRSSVNRRSDVTLRARRVCGQCKLRSQLRSAVFFWILVLYVTDVRRTVDVADLRFVGGVQGAAVRGSKRPLSGYSTKHRRRAGPTSVSWSADNGTIDITRSLIRTNNIGVCMQRRGGVTLVQQQQRGKQHDWILAIKDGMINVTRPGRRMAPPLPRCNGQKTTRTGGVARSGFGTHRSCPTARNREQHQCRIYWPTSNFRAALSSIR